MTIAIIFDEEMMKLAGKDGIAVRIEGTERKTHTCDGAGESGRAASDVGAHDAVPLSKM